MTATDIAVHPIHLGLGARAEIEPPFGGGLDWFAAYGERHAGDGAEGRLVAMFTFTEPWDAWEMHPNGSEVVLCVAGSITLHQEDAGGGAATVVLGPGQYAINPGLSTASGGHWTADATLTADFGSEAVPGTISGTVDNFMAGGEMMGWSVALGETVLSTAGGFDTATDASGDTGTNAVVWTIGGVAGAKDGAWSGALYAQGDNNVPTVATGMFSATHGTVGHMTGAFGAHVEK